MPSIFLSHSWEDKLFARKLANKLRENGIGVWLDEAELRIGDSLIQKISEAIKKTDYVAAVLSRNSVSSPWVQKELALAMSEEIAGRKVKVLPILLEKCELPEFLRDKLYADFTKPENFDTQFLRLLHAVSVSGLPPRLSEQSLRIAYSMPITGIAAEKGIPMAHGLMDCIEYINAELGGVSGHPIELMWYDNGYDAAKQVSIYKTAKDAGALFLMMCSSKMTEASLNLANRDEYPTIAIFGSIKCTHPPSHCYAIMPGYDDAWVAYATWVNYATYIVQNWRRPNAPRMALHILNNPVGHGAQMAAMASAAEMGIDIIAVEEHTPTTISEIESLTQIKVLNPDFLYISSTPAPAAIIIRNAYELGMYPGITIGCGHASFTQALIDLAGADMAEGVYGLSPIVHWGEEVPAMTKMTEYCKKLHLKDYGNIDYITSWAASLISAEILRVALNNMGFHRLNPQTVEMQGIRKIRNFSPGGLHGTVDWTDDYDRRGAKSFKIFKVMNGRITPITTWIPARAIKYEQHD